MVLNKWQMWKVSGEKFYSLSIYGYSVCAASISVSSSCQVKNNLNPRFLDVKHTFLLGTDMVSRVRAVYGGGGGELQSLGLVKKRRKSAGLLILGLEEIKKDGRRRVQPPSEPPDRR